jgi:hypothetical protein
VAGPPQEWRSSSNETKARAVSGPSSSNTHGQRDGDKRGDGYWAHEVIKLVIHDNPDGKYLIKGVGPEVWKSFCLRKEHRRSQGIIQGKRCGTTENIGPAARRRTVSVKSALK